MPYTNADGLVVRNPQDFAKNLNGENRTTYLVTYGAINQLEIDVNLAKISAGGTVNYSSDNNNDGTLDGFNTGDVYIPANSTVLRVIYVATEAAAGGTSFTVGTYGVNGTAISANSLITATEGVLANVNAAGKRVYGAGALVAATAGTAGVGTADAYVGIATTGTFTAGKGRLIIEYIDGLPDDPAS